METCSFIHGQKHECDKAWGSSFSIGKWEQKSSTARPMSSVLWWYILQNFSEGPTRVYHQLPIAKVNTTTYFCSDFPSFSVWYSHISALKDYIPKETMGTQVSVSSFGETQDKICLYHTVEDLLILWKEELHKFVSMLLCLFWLSKTYALERDSRDLYCLISRHKVHVDIEHLKHG